MVIGVNQIKSVPFTVKGNTYDPCNIHPLVLYYLSKRYCTGTEQTRYLCCTALGRTFCFFM